MGHHIAWDNQEKTVILHQYTGEASKDDLYQLARKSAEMLSTVPHTVHLIIDEGPARLTLSSADLAFLEKHVPPNQGSSAVIVAHGMREYRKKVQHTYKAVAPKAIDEAHFMASIEDARQFLQEQFDVKYP